MASSTFRSFMYLFRCELSTVREALRLAPYCMLILVFVSCGRNFGQLGRSDPRQPMRVATLSDTTLSVTRPVQIDVMLTPSYLEKSHSRCNAAVPLGRLS